MDSNVGVRNVLVIMLATSWLFKTLPTSLWPSLMSHAQSTSEHHIQVLDLRFTSKF